MQVLCCISPLCSLDLNLDPPPHLPCGGRESWKYFVWWVGGCPSPQPGIFRSKFSFGAEGFFFRTTVAGWKHPLSLPAQSCPSRTPLTTSCYLPIGPSHLGGALRPPFLTTPTHTPAPPPRQAATLSNTVALLDG